MSSTTAKGDVETVRLPKGALEQLLERYLRALYEYNEKLPKGIRLKPVHYVYYKGKKYVYIGKYFYKYEKVNGKVRWKYIGREPPEGCPPPPPNPFDGFVYAVEGDVAVVDKKVAERYLGKLISSTPLSSP